MCCGPLLAFGGPPPFNGFFQHESNSAEGGEDGGADCEGYCELVEHGVVPEKPRQDLGSCDNVFDSRDGAVCGGVATCSITWPRAQFGLKVL